MRIVFLGTPAFAVPTLEALVHQPGQTVTAVVCQPDRPAGRKGAVQAPPVKRAAEALGLPVYQPEHVRGAAAQAWLSAQQPDVLAVVAFGQLLPVQVFSLPRLGAINAHASLLPAYRGAAPIQWTLARGESQTGVTTMRIDAGLDTGDMLLQDRLAIGACETAPELSARLAALAARLMVATLTGLAAGALEAHPQRAGATPAPLLKREDGRIQWSWTAQEIYNRWRGFEPWPGVHTRFRGRQLAILRCRVLPEVAAEPGRLLDYGSQLAVACGRGGLGLDEVRLEGRQASSGAAFARGARIVWGTDSLA
ncbi:MAG: methionyl-tRNA formyltransferase [Terriglobales bacterium]